jgi:biopolymer transport protein ExbD
MSATTPQMDEAAGAAGPDGPANFPVIPKRGGGNLHLRRKRRKKKSDMQEGPAEELNLTAMMDMMTIILVFHKPIVEVRGGALDPSVKREGANGYFVEPIWVRLQKVADLQKTLVRQGKLKEFKGQAVVVADRTIPFRLLSEIIYSAGQAEFHSFKFLLIKKGG